MRIYNWKVLLALAIFFWASSAYRLKAQPDFDEWPRAQVILASGDTLYGSVAYHHNEEIIRLILEDGTNQAFSPVGVQSFAVADERGNYRKRYRSYYWNRGNEYSNYQVPSFFEVLQEGPYTLVRREVLALRNQSMVPVFAGYGRNFDPTTSGYYPGFHYQEANEDALYLLTPQKKIIPLYNPKKDLVKLFGDKYGFMKQFIQSRALSYEDTRDVMVMIDYFNQL